MYNEFAEDVEEPTTIDNYEIEDDHYITSVNASPWIPPRGTRDQTSHHLRMRSVSVERVQFKTFRSFSNARCTICASYQKSPTDLRPEILRNNKPSNLELCREPMKKITLIITWGDRKTAKWTREKTKACLDPFTFAFSIS